MASVAPMPPAVTVVTKDDLSSTPVKALPSSPAKSPGQSPSKWQAMRAAFSGAAKTTAVDLASLPPEVREVLGELDIDGSGTLDVSEIHAAVTLLNSSRKVAQRAHYYIVALLCLLGLLLAALLGVSYAAAVLAATTKGANGSLQDTNGVTLRTAGSAISSVNSGFQPAGAGRRRLAADDDGTVPEEFFAHRRRRMTIQDQATGRRLAVTDPQGDEYAPKPLILLATVRGQVALDVCKFSKEGHFNVVLPKFDPYEEGIESVIAAFKPSTMAGCAELDHAYGFAGDFGVTFHAGGSEAIFHLDCPGPVTADSSCNVHRAFLIAQPPDVSNALQVDFSQPRNDSFFNVTADGELLPLVNIATGRRLGPGAWPPSSTLGIDVSESACPTLTYTTGFPTRTGVGLDDSSAWKDAVLKELNLNPGATPQEQAKLLCQSSVFCMVGWAVGSGAVFKPDFWTGAGSAALSMSRYIVNDFKSTLSLSNQKAMWNSFKSAQAHKCSTTYSYAVCLNMNSIVTLNGLNKYSCKTWNVNDFKAGGMEIASSCANSCEMLQWYSAWWANYRVGSYDTTQGVPSPFDGAKYKYLQDYCGTSTIVKNTPSGYYYGGVTDSSSRAQYTAKPPYTTHPKCWAGKRIPLCRSFNIITKTTC